MNERRKMLLHLIHEEGKCLVMSAYPTCSKTCPVGAFCQAQAPASSDEDIVSIRSRRFKYCLSKYIKNYGRKALKNDLVEYLI